MLSPSLNSSLRTLKQLIDSNGQDSHMPEIVVGAADEMAINNLCSLTLSFLFLPLAISPSSSSLPESVRQ